VAGRQRGRAGRGWDAAPPSYRRAGEGSDGGEPDGRSERGAGAGSGAATGGSRAGARGRGPGFDRRVEDQSESVDPAEQAREICLRQLAVRPRTQSELATALRKRGIADEVAAVVLERYREVGIIDDRAFAKAWVTSRHHGRGLARRALAGELRRKGVDAEAVGAALEELDHDTEAQTARAFVDRKLRTDRGGPPEASLRRLVSMLARKGYPPGLAIRVVKEALADRDEAIRLDDTLDEDLLADEMREAEEREAEMREAEARRFEPHGGADMTAGASEM
jgi:regulatory protein